MKDDERGDGHYGPKSGLAGLGFWRPAVSQAGTARGGLCGTGVRRAASKPKGIDSPNLDLDDEEHSNGLSTAGFAVVAVVGVVATLGMAQSASAPPMPRRRAAPLTAPVTPGTTVRAILNVKVAPGFHIQSDKPRDPSLIPLTVTLDAPPGVSVAGLVFPPPKDFTLKGSDQPLAVFEGAFPIEARLAIADRPPGWRESGSCSGALSGVRRDDLLQANDDPDGLDVERGGCWTENRGASRRRHPQRRRRSRRPVRRRIRQSQLSRPLTSPAGSVAAPRSRRQIRSSSSIKFDDPRHGRRLCEHARVPEVHQRRRARREVERALRRPRGRWRFCCSFSLAAWRST